MYNAPTPRPAMMMKIRSVMAKAPITPSKENEASINSK